MLGRVLPQDADGQRAIKRGSGAFAGDVAKSKGETAFAVRKEIVKVAAQFASGSVTRSEIEARNFPRASGEKLALNFASGVQVREQALLVFAGFLVEAAVFQSDRNVGAESGEHTLVLGGKGMRLNAFEVENADQAVAQQERDNQFRANGNGIGGTAAIADIAGIQTDVTDAQGAALAGGRAGDAFVERDAKARGDGVFVVHGEDAFEKLGLLVPEHDGEKVVVDELLDAFGDAAEKLFAVENGRKLAADVVKERKCFGLFRMGSEQAFGDVFGVAENETAEFGEIVHVAGAAR